MKIRNQNIFNFDKNKNFNYEDYFVSKSNYFAFEILQRWPKWEKNIISIKVLNTMIQLIKKINDKKKHEF